MGSRISCCAVVLGGNEFAIALTESAHAARSAYGAFVRNGHFQFSIWMGDCFGTARLAPVRERVVSIRPGVGCLACLERYEEVLVHYRLVFSTDRGRMVDLHVRDPLPADGVNAFFAVRAKRGAATLAFCVLFLGLGLILADALTRNPQAEGIEHQKEVLREEYAVY